MSSRISSLDGLRGLAAAVVMVVHGAIAFDFALYSGLGEHSRNTWDLAVSRLPLLIPFAGNLSVCLFFVLSGFVLARSYRETEWGVFPLFLKRWVRLGFPILCVCLLGWCLHAVGAVWMREVAAETRSTWLAGHWVSEPNWKEALRDGAYRSLLGIPGGATYNLNLWTMGIEFWGSVAVLLITWVARRWSWFRPALPWGCLLLALACYGYYVALFPVGALMEHLHGQRGVTRRSWPLWAGGGCLLVGIFFGTVPYSAVRGPFWDWLVTAVPRVPVWPFTGKAYVLNAITGEAVWHAFGAVLILLAVLRTTSFENALKHPFCLWLGRLSYPLYLVHLPVLFSVGCGSYLLCRRWGVSPDLSAVSALVFYTMSSLWVAWLFERWIERAALEWSRRVASLFAPRSTSA